MTIFVNGKFLAQPMTGVQRFAIEISREIVKVFDDVVFLVPHNYSKEVHDLQINVKVVGSFTGTLWEQVELPRYLSRIKKPLLLCLTGSAPILYKNKVITLHDLAFLRVPDALSRSYRLYYQFAMPILIARSVHIFTVSRYSKADIQETYGIAPKKISVVYNSVDLNKFRDGKIALKNSCNEGYILAVGSIQSYKNIEFLVETFLSLKRNKEISPETRLYLVGGMNTKVFHKTEFLDRLCADESIVLTGRVNDQDLEKLYQGAQALIFPSIFEGFGIPPLEAMACGCPVVASNATSIPEVCGDAAVYFDPRDAASLSDAMLKMLRDPKLRERMRKNGFKNIKRFDWRRSAELIVKKLEDLGYV